MAARPTTRMAMAIALFLTAGCGSCESSKKPASAPASGEGKAATKPGEPSKKALESEPAKKLGPPPKLRLAVRYEQGRQGRLVVSLQNRDARRVELERGLELQRADGEGFSPVAELDATLAAECGQEQREGCRPLAPGAELRPAPIVSLEPGGQCGCASCAPLPPGRYRVAVTGCDDAFTVASEPIGLGK